MKASKQKKLRHPNIATNLYSIWVRIYSEGPKKALFLVKKSFKVFAFPVC